MTSIKAAFGESGASSPQTVPKEEAANVVNSSSTVPRLPDSQSSLALLTIHTLHTTIPAKSSFNSLQALYPTKGQKNVSETSYCVGHSR